MFQKEYDSFQTLRVVAGTVRISQHSLSFKISILQRTSKLEQYNLSLSQVVEAIENNNANVGGSVLNRGDLGYVVRGIGLIGNLDDLGHIVVSTTSGVPVFLNDIGSLKYGNLERKGVLGYTDASTTWLRDKLYCSSLDGSTSTWN